MNPARHAARTAPVHASGPRAASAHYLAMDGYRGLFIVLVIAYHFGASALVGGWIGINHFFVFSGFLIGRILVQERLRTGRIDVVGFYLRRARRILPVAVVAITAVLIHLMVYGAAANRQQTAGDAFATATFWLNWRLIERNDLYFDLFSDPSPLRHLWTLAVEEQFYLVIPWLLLVLFALVRRRSHRWVIVAAAAVGSAVWTALLVGQSETTASRLYYGTDVRMQALLVGVAVAVWHTPTPGRPPFQLSRRLTEAIGWFATAISIGAFFVLTEETTWVFRYGGMLAFTVIAAAMGLSAFDQRDLLLNRIFSIRPLVHLGRISYGLYAFHWPIGLWLPLAGWPRPVAALVQFGLTWACAAVSFRYLELPIMRHGLRRLIPVTGLRSALGPGAVAAVAGISLILWSALPPAGQDPGNGQALSAETTYRPPSPPVRTAVVGDSIPASLLDGYAPERYPGLEISRFAEYGGCNPVPVTLSVAGKHIPEDAHCPAWRASWPAQVRARSAEVVLAPAGLGFVLPQVIDGREVPLRSEQVRRALVANLEALHRQFRASGARQLQVINVPCRVLEPGRLGSSARRSVGEKPIPLDPTWANALIQEWARAHPTDVRVLDLNQQVCADGYRATINGALLYHDGVHFSDAGAALVWTWLAPSVAAAARAG